MQKYRYNGDYMEVHRKIRLHPGEIVELPDVPARLRNWLELVVEEEVKAPEPAPAKPKKTPKRKKSKSIS